MAIAGAQAGDAGKASFRAGWIVGKDGQVVGNITIRSIQQVALTGNIIDLSKFVLASTGLSVDRVKERIAANRSISLVIGDVGSTATVFLFNPCGDEFDLSTEGCCSCASFNNVVIKVQGGLERIGISDTNLNRYLDKLLDGAAMTLTDFCSSVNFNQCG